VRGGTVSGNINSFIVLIDSFVGNVNERKAPIGLEGVIPLLGHHTGCPSITGHRRSIFQGRTGNGTGGFLLAKVPILARQAGCPVLGLCPLRTGYAWVERLPASFSL
jgi:hypothetical protein